MLRRLGRELDAVEHWAVGRDFGGEFEYGAMYALKDMEAYHTYLHAPLHRKIDEIGLPLVDNMISLDADGTITLRGRNHKLSVAWDVTRSDALYAEEQAYSGELVRKLGGRPFVTPTWRLLRQPVTVHNLGGAPMGTDPDTAVVDLEGQVFGHPGLYVIDGAILPGATGGNPSLTIAAVAERCMEAVVRRITGVRDWVAPQSADVRTRDVPEDAAVEAVVARGARASMAPGIRIREVMSGSAALPDRPEQSGRIILNLQGAIPDLRAFLDDPVHTVTLTGTIQVEGLTSRPATVDGGTMHLLANVDGGSACTMDYLLPFTDVEGNRWLLQGTKYVQRGWGNNPWRATTVLHVAITRPEDRVEGTVPSGRVTISFRESLRLVSNVRPTGTTSPTSAARAVARFGAFLHRPGSTRLPQPSPPTNQAARPLTYRLPVQSEAK